MDIAFQALLALTPAAIKKIKEYNQALEGAKDKHFRLAVRAGGCSGYSYDFTFDDKRPTDIEIPAEDLVIVTDAASLKFVRGCTLDYVESLRGAGFTVKNPNAKASCGCGTSFAV